MYRSNNSAVIVKGARYMPCTLIDEESGREYRLNIKSPKLKTLRKFDEISEESSINDLISITVALLSHNKEGIKITNDIVENTMEIDELYAFFDDFSTWLTETRNANPN